MILRSSFLLFFRSPFPFLLSPCLIYMSSPLFSFSSLSFSFFFFSFFPTPALAVMGPCLFRFSEAIAPVVMGWILSSAPLLGTLNYGPTWHFDSRLEPIFLQSV